MSMLCCGIGKTRTEERPKTVIRANGTLMSALWDTGTGASTISWDMFCSLKYKPWFESCKYEVTNARGRRMRVLGITKLHLSIGKNEFLHNLMVLADCMNDIVIGSDLMAAQGYQLVMGKRQIRRVSNGTGTQGKIMITSSKYLMLEPFKPVRLGFTLGGDASDVDMQVEHGDYVSEGTCKIKNGKGVIVMCNRGLIPIQIRRGHQVCLLRPIRQPPQRVSFRKERAGITYDRINLNASSARSSTTQRFNSIAKERKVAWEPEQPKCSSEPLRSLNDEKIGTNNVRKGSRNHILESSKTLPNKIIKSSTTRGNGNVESKFHFLLQSFPDVVIASELVHDEQKPSKSCEEVVSNIVAEIPGCKIAPGGILIDTVSAEICIETLSVVLEGFRQSGVKLNLSAVRAESNSVTFWGYESGVKATIPKMADMKPDFVSKLSSVETSASLNEATESSISHMSTPLSIRGPDSSVDAPAPEWASDLVAKQNTKSSTFEAIQSQVLTAQKSDNWAKALACYVKYNIVPENRKLRKWVLKYGKVARISSNLVGISENKWLKCFAPKTIRKRLMLMCHGAANHNSTEGTIAELASWFWPELEADVTNLVTNCKWCRKERKRG